MDSLAARPLWITWRIAILDTCISSIMSMSSKQLSIISGNSISNPVNFARDHAISKIQLWLSNFQCAKCSVRERSLDSPLQTKLTLEDLLPVDKMKLTHATAIIGVASDLQRSTDQATVALGDFLQQLSSFYEAFRNNKVSIAERYCTILHS